MKVTAKSMRSLARQRKLVNALHRIQNSVHEHFRDTGFYKDEITKTVIQELKDRGFSVQKRNGSGWDYKVSW
jgi:hypothetical protein